MKEFHSTVPRFSLIIPAYNEEAYLPALLKSVAKARACYTGGTDEIEVVVNVSRNCDHLYYRLIFIFNSKKLTLAINAAFDSGK